MERTIYLLRHGQPQLPEGARLCLGHTDVPLSPAGQRQMRRLARYFAALGPAAVYGSDLARSRDCAILLAQPLGLEPRLRPELREIDMGQWDGLAFAEIKRRWPEAYRQRGCDIWRYAAPGGESFAQCAHRAQAALAAIARVTVGDVLIVAHAGFNRALLWQWGVRPQAGLTAIAQDYGGLNRLRLSAAGEWRVEAVNEQVQEEREEQQ